MLVEERRQRVLDLISTRGFVGLADLAQTVAVSESTIRRDLDYWHQQGTIRRTHGGAIFIGDATSMPGLEERSDHQLDEKRQIAQATAERIHDGETILLDGGTTTLEVARCLMGRSVQIVTNSLPIAQLLAGQRDTDVVFLGGYVYPKTGVALGPLTIRMLEDIHVQQTILSISGITARGFFNSNLLLVETERQMMRCADEVVVVADHTKIGRSALAFLCPFDEIDTLITDSGLLPNQRDLLDQSQVRLVVGA